MTLDELKSLACEMHENECMNNHTDSCAWDHEFSAAGDTWREYAHNEWLKRAKDRVEQVLYHLSIEGDSYDLPTIPER